MLRAHRCFRRLCFPHDRPPFCAQCVNITELFFCRDRNIADNCIITLVTDMHFEMSVSGRMLCKIFGSSSLKKVGL
jgi:hypothetical protein